MIQTPVVVYDQTLCPACELKFFTPPVRSFSVSENYKLESVSKVKSITAHIVV